MVWSGQALRVRQPVARAPRLRSGPYRHFQRDLTSPHHRPREIGPVPCAQSNAPAFIPSSPVPEDFPKRSALASPRSYVKRGPSRCRASQLGVLVTWRVWSGFGCASPSQLAMESQLGRTGTAVNGKRMGVGGGECCGGEQLELAQGCEGWADAAWGACSIEMLVAFCLSAAAPSACLSLLRLFPSTSPEMSCRLFDPIVDELCRCQRPHCSCVLNANLQPARAILSRP